MRLWLWRIAVLAPLCLSVWSLVVLMRDTPLAQPLVDRGTAAVRAELDRMLAWRMTPAWVRAEIEAALAAKDLDRVRSLAVLAAQRGMEPSEELMQRIQALEAARTGVLASSGTCLRCMADIAACPSISHVAACGVPFELSPLGDLNALRRAGFAYATGVEVDRIEAALATVGVGATAMVLLTGGSSATVKAGATAVRVARRMRLLTPGLSADLARLGDVGLRRDRVLPYVLGRVPLEQVADTAKLARLSGLAADMGRIAENTGSLIDPLLLLRHADDAGDVTRLARVSDASGPATRGVIETLGPARAFRALVRLSDAALGALALLWTIAVQAGTALAGMLGSWLLRRVRRLLRPRRIRAPGPARKGTVAVSAQSDDSGAHRTGGPHAQVPRHPG